MKHEVTIKVRYGEDFFGSHQVMDDDIERHRGHLAWRTWEYTPKDGKEVTVRTFDRDKPGGWPPDMHEHGRTTMQSMAVFDNPVSAIQFLQDQLMFFSEIISFHVTQPEQH